MKDDLTVGECMTVGVITLPEKKSVYEAARLLRKTQVGCIIVTSNSKADGIVTERDIIYKVVASGLDPKKATLQKVMSCPLRVIEAKSSVEDAALAMKKHRVKRLPVIDSKERLIGIVTEGDLLRVYPGMTAVLVEKARMKELPEGAAAKPGKRGGKYLDYDYKEETDV